MLNNDVENYPLHLTHVGTLPCNVLPVRIVHSLKLVLRVTRMLTTKRE